MTDLEHTVRVICPAGLAAGFELAGIAPERAEDGEQAAEKLSRLAAEPDAGVVLIEEQLYRAIPERVLEDLTRQPLPVVVPFPGAMRRGRPRLEEYVVELLRRAIGYRVRPR